MLQTPFNQHCDASRVARSRSARSSSARSSSARSSSARSRRGFTLIELIVVMGIMLSLSLVVVGSYVGMTRAIAAQSGINALRNAVILTRQHACMDGQRTYLYILDGTNYVLSRRVGVVSMHAAGDGTFYDYYSDLGSFDNSYGGSTTTVQGLRLYNFGSTAAGRRPYGTVERVSREPRKGGWRVDYKHDTDSSFFKAGNVYGIEVYPMRSLPKGFLFGDKYHRRAMYFEPSGAPGGLTEIEIFEEIKPDIVQRVYIANGRIRVETEGTAE